MFQLKVLIFQECEDTVLGKGASIAMVALVAHLHSSPIIFLAFMVAWSTYAFTWFSLIARQPVP